MCMFPSICVANRSESMETSNLSNDAVFLFKKLCMYVFILKSSKILKIMTEKFKIHYTYSKVITPLMMDALSFIKKDSQKD